MGQYLRWAILVVVWAWGTWTVPAGAQTLFTSDPNPLREASNAQDDPAAKQEGSAPTPEAKPEVAAQGGDEDSTGAPSDLLSREQLEQRIAALEAAGEEDPTRAEAAKQLRATLDLLASLEQQRGQLAHFKSELELVPEWVKSRRAVLAAPPAEPQAPATGLAAAALQEGLQQREALVTSKRSDLDRFQKMQKDRAARLVAIPEELAKAQRQLQQVQAALAENQGQDGANSLAFAQQQQRRYEDAHLKALIDALKAEEEYKTKGSEALQLRIDVLSRELSLAERELTQWQEAVKLQRRAEAERQAAEAQRAAEVVRAPALEEYARENAKLAEE
ncbi:MAG: hypothetical protein KDA61_02085, partial [Planctomycetales bacterium]|nr:hypothetical protein [Planctomycetales bacterium]